MEVNCVEVQKFEVQIEEVYIEVMCIRDEQLVHFSHSRVFCYLLSFIRSRVFV